MGGESRPRGAMARCVAGWMNHDGREKGDGYGTHGRHARSWENLICRDTNIERKLEGSALGTGDAAQNTGGTGNYIVYIGGRTEVR